MPSLPFTQSVVPPSLAAGTRFLQAAARCAEESAGTREINKVRGVIESSERRCFNFVGVSPEIVSCAAEREDRRGNWGGRTCFPKVALERGVAAEEKKKARGWAHFSFIFFARARIYPALLAVKAPLALYREGDLCVSMCRLLVFHILAFRAMCMEKGLRGTCESPCSHFYPVTFISCSVWFFFFFFFVIRNTLECEFLQNR